MKKTKQFVSNDRIDEIIEDVGERILYTTNESQVIRYLIALGYASLIGEEDVEG